MKQSKRRFAFKLYESPLFTCSLMSASTAILAAPLSSRVDIASALASATKVVMYSLEPGEAGARDPDGACVGLCYYGWPVLGQVEISRRARLIGQVTSWLKNPDPNEKALCFDPRHGLRVITTEAAFDFVVCFECEGVEIYVDSKPVEVSPHPNNIQRDWDRLLKKAGVLLAEPYSD